MGKDRDNCRKTGSFPAPSSSSSSDFEFSVSLSPSSRRSSSHLCPADELFYKGQLLPLHLSPRISMVRTLLLSSSSTSSSSTDTATTASRDSNGSSSSSASSISPDILLLLPETDSSRPSSATEEDAHRATASRRGGSGGKYLASLATRFSLAFLNRGGSKRDPSPGIDLDLQLPSHSSTKRVNSSAKQLINKYVKKVKPLYEKLSPSQKSQNQSQSQIQNQSQSQIQSQQKKKPFSFSIRRQRDVSLSNACNIVGPMKKLDEDEDGEINGGISHSHSFSGNLKFPRRKRCAGSCPSSMRSSPTHSGLLRFGEASTGASSSSSASSSSMEELQSAIQGAIAHCKSTMIQSTVGSLNVTSVN